MPRRLGWCGTVPLLALGLFSAHALGYRLAVSDPHARAEALAESGHGYFAYAPVGLSLCLALLIAAFASRVTSPTRREHPRAAGGVLALLPPLAFVLQEHLERLIHAGHFPTGLILEPVFLLGLAMQVPFALAVLVLAALLGSLAVRIGLIAARRRRRPAPRLSPPSRPVLVYELSRSRPLALGYPERGPPILALSP